MWKTRKWKRDFTNKPNLADLTVESCKYAKFLYNYKTKLLLEAILKYKKMKQTQQIVGRIVNTPRAFSAVIPL